MGRWQQQEMVLRMHGNNNRIYEIQTGLIFSRFHYRLSFNGWLI